MEEPCASWLLFLKKFDIGKLQAFCHHGARAMLSSGVNGVPIGVIRASSPEVLEYPSSGTMFTFTLVQASGGFLVTIVPLSLES